MTLGQDEGFQMRAPHNVILHSGQGLEAQFSNLPDENNFQASGGAALTSFGGFARVVVLLVVLLGVLYHGFMPTVIFGSDAVRPAAVTLPVPQHADSARDDSLPLFGPTNADLEPKTVAIAEALVSAPAPTQLRADVIQKISKRAAKKEKRAAKRQVGEVVKSLQTAKADESAEVKAVEQVLVKEEAHPKPLEEEEEERRCEELVNTTGWVENAPRPFEKTSVIIKRAKRMLVIHEELLDRRTRHYANILSDLDLSSFVVDPRTENCPAAMQRAPAPLLDLDLTYEDQDVPPIPPPSAAEVENDKVATPGAPVMIPPMEMNSMDWVFNSHKKAAWMLKQRHSVKYPMPPAAPIPGLVPYGWSPIRTPCKFAAGCKKPGCQFTHPWTPSPVEPAF